jgi:branched-chain amino acid transport system permease protein
MIEAYFIHLAIIILIYAILAVSLNLAVGYTGLLNLGHIAFYGIGAYTSALLTKNLDVPFLLALLTAGIVAAFFGFLLTLVTNKLKGDYLALATLGFSFVVTAVLLNWISLTRGPLGIPGISKPIIFGLKISTGWPFMVFMIILATICITIMWIITRSPFGRLMQATRDDEVGLEALGKNTFSIKIRAMMIAAFFAGIAGSCFAHYISFIDPSSFHLAEIILLFTIVIVGGLASIRGTILAAIIITLIPEALRFVSMPSTILGPMRQIIYALILILIIMYRPRGLLGKVDLG